MALAPVASGETSGDPYKLIALQRTTRANNDGTFTPVVNITLQSVKYGVQFTFTLLASTYDTDGGPPLEEERTGWVDAVCAYPHVHDFWSEVDQGPSQVLYNYGVITVGSDDGSVTDQVRRRMDQLNEPATFQAINAAVKRLNSVGAGL